MENEEEEMILEDDPNDEGVMETIAEAAQEAELEHIAESQKRMRVPWLISACHPKCHRNPQRSL